MKKLIKQLLIEGLNFKYLSDKLLSFGGDKVHEVYEEDLDKLITRGVLFKPNKVRVVKMRVSKCHENSACFWGNYTNEHGTDNLKIATGWVLAENDVWYQHTWLYQPKTNDIIETTHKRQQYFGFLLTDGEAYDFYDENYF